MKTFFLTFLTAISFLTVNASFVIAECAWVLWVENETTFFEEANIKTTDRWKIHSAVPKYEQCLQMRKELWDKMKKYYNEQKKTMGGIEKIEAEPFFINKTLKDNKGFLVESYHCLPDTLDPRK